MKIRFEHGHRDHLKTMHPAYFAMVMATGIVSITLFLHHVPMLPTIFLYLNALFLTGLLITTVLRFVLYRSDFIADIHNHGRGMGFFTVVAGVATFGTQLVIQTEAVALGMPFWIAATILWVIITYGMLSVLIVKADKPTIQLGLNGAWLVIIVAAQSVVILTVLLLDNAIFAGFRHELIFAALVLWLSGGVIYFWIITLIFFRFMFVHMAPEDLAPPYWINMGAAAISTLAGALLVEHASLSPVLVDVLPFIKGLVLLFWSIASWWIPLLIILGIWRYLIAKKSFSYDPLYWGCVFPLGMYSVCTFHLNHAIDVPFVLSLSELFMLIAAIAWLTTFIGFIDSQINGVDAFPHEK